MHSILPNILYNTNSAVDSLIIDLNNDVKVESTIVLQPEVQKTDKEDVQTNTTDLISVATNDNLSKKVITSTILHDLEDQRREDVELESDNYKSMLNPTTPLYTIDNTKNIINDEKLTKDNVIRLEKDYDLSLTIILILFIVNCMVHQLYIPISNWLKCIQL